MLHHEGLGLFLRLQLDRVPPGIEPALTEVTEGVPSAVSTLAPVGGGRQLGQLDERKGALGEVISREPVALVASSAERQHATTVRRSGDCRRGASLRRRSAGESRPASGLPALPEAVGARRALRAVFRRQRAQSGRL